MQIETIINEVCQEFNCSPEQLREKNRKWQIHDGRIMAYHLCRSFGFSTPIIAKEVGNRHHTTIITGSRRAKALAETDKQFKRKQQNIIHRIKPELI